MNVSTDERERCHLHRPESIRCCPATPATARVRARIDPACLRGTAIPPYSPSIPSGEYKEPGTVSLRRRRELNRKPVEGRPRVKQCGDPEAGATLLRCHQPRPQDLRRGATLSSWPIFQYAAQGMIRQYEWQEAAIQVPGKAAGRPHDPGPGGHVCRADWRSLREARQRRSPLDRPIRGG